MEYDMRVPSLSVSVLLLCLITSVLSSTSNSSSEVKREDNARYYKDRMPTSQPILFAFESDSDADIVNSTLVVKRKKPNTQKEDTKYRAPPTFYSSASSLVVNNHKKFNGASPSTEGEKRGVVWHPPPSSSQSGIISNHKLPNDDSDFQWTMNSNKRKFQTTTTTTEKPFPTTTSPPPRINWLSSFSTSHKELFQASSHPIKVENERPVISVNNHKSFNSWTRFRPKPVMPAVSHAQSSIVSVTEMPGNSAGSHISGSKIKLPDKIHSKVITVLNAPEGTKTTIKHNKLIVRQREPGVKTTNKKTLTPQDDLQMLPSELITSSSVTDKFSTAPVKDPWASIPIPSKPTWAGISSVTAKPPKGTSISQGTSVSQGTASMFPGMPIVPFLSSLISPLLKKPLTSGAVNTGMQGIKAMQGFLRNSLIGAMRN